MHLAEIFEVLNSQNSDNEDDDIACYADSFKQTLKLIYKMVLKKPWHK